MGKGDRAKKPRKKIKAVSLPGVTPVKRRKSQGSKRMKEIALENKATVIRARAHQMGMDWGEEAARLCSLEMLECGAGRAIFAYCRSNRLSVGEHGEPLWMAFKHAATVLRQNAILYTGATGTAKTARIEMAPEPFETNEDDIHLEDTRTDDERQEAAVRRFDALNGWLDHYTDPMAYHELVRLAQGQSDDVRDADGLIRCCQCISEGLAGEKVVARRRGLDAGKRLV